MIYFCLPNNNVSFRQNKYITGSSDEERSDDNEEAMYAGKGYIRNLCTLNFDVNLKKLSLKNLQGVMSNARVQTSWFRLIVYQTQK